MQTIRNAALVCMSLGACDSSGDGPATDGGEPQTMPTTAVGFGDRGYWCAQADPERSCRGMWTTWLANRGGESLAGSGCHCGTCTAFIVGADGCTVADESGPIARGWNDGRADSLPEVDCALADEASALLPTFVPGCLDDTSDSGT